MPLLAFVESHAAKRRRPIHSWTDARFLRQGEMCDEVICAVLRSRDHGGYAGPITGADKRSLFRRLRREAQDASPLLVGGTG
ncbi:hypothetical protein MRX96_031049 [Rhipicephalus microplus]